MSRSRLDSTLYHRRLLPPRFDRLAFHTPHPLTGQRDCRGSCMCAIHRDTTLLTQHVSDSTSNEYVQVLSVSARILTQAQRQHSASPYISSHCRTLMCESLREAVSRV